MTTETGRAGRREWIGLAVLALPCLLVVMDLTVLFLAVPQLTEALEPSAAELLWITDAYGFLIAGSLIVMGTLGDRIGRRRVLLAGGATFAAASVLAAVSMSPEMLIAARALQGLAGATLVPSTMALVFTMFPDEGQRRRALATVMSSFAAGAALGPLVGGALLSVMWWGSVFLLNVPVMALLLVLGPRLLPEFKDPDAGRLDLASAALSLVAVLGAIAAIKELAAGDAGFTFLAWAAGALVAGTAFLRRQRGLESPLVDPALFRIRTFSTALCLNVAGAFVMYGMFLFTSQYLQLGAGLSPFAAGACGLPGIAALMLVANLVPRITGRVRPATAIASGLAVSAVGFALLTRLRADDGVALIVVADIVMSIGIAPLTVLATELIVGAAPPEQAGAASGVAHTGNELGGALGIALLGSLGTAVYRDRMGEADPDTFGEAVAAGGALLARAEAAFIDAVQAAAAANAAIALAAAAAAAALLVRRRAGAPA